MSLIVQKFGGSSVADADKIRNVCNIIADTKAQGHRVVVVLSAQGDTTDDLITKMDEITERASLREKHSVPVEVLSSFQRIPGTTVCELNK